MLTNVTSLTNIVNLKSTVINSNLRGSKLKEFKKALLKSRFIPKSVISITSVKLFEIEEIKQLKEMASSLATTSESMKILNTMADGISIINSGVTSLVGTVAKLSNERYNINTHLNALVSKVDTLENLMKTMMKRQDDSRVCMEQLNQSLSILSHNVELSMFIPLNLPSLPREMIPAYQTLVSESKKHPEYGFADAELLDWCLNANKRNVDIVNAIERNKKKSSATLVGLIRCINLNVDAANILSEINYALNEQSIEY